MGIVKRGSAGDFIKWVLGVPKLIGYVV